MLISIEDLSLRHLTSALTPRAVGADPRFAMPHTAATTGNLPSQHHDKSAGRLPSRRGKVLPAIPFIQVEWSIVPAEAFVPHLLRERSRRQQPTQPEPEASASDAELVALAMADLRQFALLYTRYLDPVHRYCYRRLGSREAAEDATSAVFTKALAAFPRYRDASFRAWLFTIAHHVKIGRAHV